MQTESQTESQIRSANNARKEPTVTITLKHWRDLTDLAIKSNHETADKAAAKEGGLADPMQKMMITLIALNTCVELEKLLFPKN